MDDGSLSNRARPKHPRIERLESRIEKPRTDYVAVSIRVGVAAILFGAAALGYFYLRDNAPPMTSDAPVESTRIPADFAPLPESLVDPFAAPEAAPDGAAPEPMATDAAPSSATEQDMAAPAPAEPALPPPEDAPAPTP